MRGSGEEEETEEGRKKRNSVGEVVGERGVIVLTSMECKHDSC